jgi:hypothetical protein
MVAALAISGLLIVITTAVQFEAMMLVARLQRLWNLPSRLEAVALVVVAFAAHLVHIALYAAVYAWMHIDPGWGALGGQIGATIEDFIYFSATCYTTLGFGDVFPTGPMRIVAGLEGLNGLVLIAWSASFTFIAVQDRWGDRQED